MRRESGLLLVCVVRPFSVPLVAAGDVQQKRPAQGPLVFACIYGRCQYLIDLLGLLGFRWRSCRSDVRSRLMIQMTSRRLGFFRLRSSSTNSIARELVPRGIAHKCVR